MIFVVNNVYTSALLRGGHVAAALGVECKFADLGHERNGMVVFVKEADRGLALDAKDRGNKIVFDPVDLHCYKDRTCVFDDLVDVLIVPNRACPEFYRAFYPNARFAVIPHQWDARIKGAAPQDRLRAGYIGKAFNCPPEWDGEKVTQSPDMLGAAPRFNLHIALNQRLEKHVLLKPSTKISIASAVGANVVTYRDPGAVELLGPDYPFYVDSDPMAAIRMARASFGGKAWKLGREIMKTVKAKTSLEAVATLYRRLADGDPAMLLDAPIAEAA
jgi:hypothetical protein